MMTAVSGEPITEHLAVTVHRQTEGNPLFVQEVARYLREEQLLTTGNGEVELRVPEGVRDVIGKRLSRLSKECNQMLAVASVIGRDFDLGILLEVPGLSQDDLYYQLEGAQGSRSSRRAPVSGAG
jgi:predicted ATPase